MVRQLLFLSFFLLLVLDAVAEGKTKEIPFADISGEGYSHVVARDTTARLSFPAAAFTSYNRRDILVAYLRTDTARRIVFSLSGDGGRTWRETDNGDQWQGELLSLSMFNLGRTIINRADEKRRYQNNNTILFAGGVPMKISASYSMGRDWTPFTNANNFGGYKVSGIVQLRDQRLMAFMHDDGRFISGNNSVFHLRKSAIYKIYSSDGGVTWSRPDIAIKHNIDGLYDAFVMRSPERYSRLFAISSSRSDNRAYISFSDDEGDSWSYPVVLNEGICGDRFYVSAIKKRLYIAYRDMAQTLSDGCVNPSFGDLVMWHGRIDDLLGLRDGGVKVRIADNFPVERVDYSDRRVYDCGYPSVLPISKGEVSVIAYGRWDGDDEPYIKNFVVSTSVFRDIRD